MQIRKYDPATDYAGLRNCIVALQDYEYRIDDRFPDGESMVDDYIPDIIYRSKLYEGDIFVAEVGAAIVGYAMVWARFKSGDVEDGDFECGLLADLAVLEEHRGKGYGKAMIDFAEQYVRDKGARYLRLGVMAKNTVARELYERLGFTECHVDFEKDLAKTE
ncbi:MAG: GNAT family N-acetyltransferase [Pseudomonadota bacterium]